MTIKVIRRGTPPAERKYKATCTHCGSELEWAHKDAQRVHAGDQREGPFTQITCPVCKHAITGYQGVAQQWDR